ncbi:MAG TPA: MOSC domain-containing protein [Solirubrobacteraceae bacterium]|nr:MOSC domain-containing protein [Solirubrobacteraceae bacterium]
MSAEIVSLQVGRPAPLPWRGGSVPSAIVKTPVAGRVALGPLGLAGDEQADRAVHGGPDKAVCCYPVEHRARWEAELGVALPHGAFGENLSTHGLVEAAAGIGDVLRAGTAVVQVSQPRGPCYKLAARWGHRTLPGLMARAGISGWYLRVLEPGEVGAGDTLELLEAAGGVTVADVMDATYGDGRRDAALIRRVLDSEALAASWHESLLGLWRRRALPVRDFGVGGD